MESPPPYNGGDVELSIPPLDPHFELFPENDDVFAVNGDFPVDVDFDFTFDDLSFADNLLLEQPDPNSDPDPLVLSSEISHEWARDECVPVSSEESNCVDLRSKSIKLEQPKCSDHTDQSTTNECVSKSRSKRKGEEGEKGRVRKARKGNENESVITKKNDEDEGESEGGDDDDDDDDDKRRARLIRNRESAQLSRQRKKKYVEELEDKVRVMHSTITDLNAKVSYFMTENASLRHQLSCVGGGAAGGVAMYPTMAYPWMVYPPAYMVKHQGSSVPLVPIPRLKTQQNQDRVQKKSSESRKEKTTKKVASVSLVGLLFFMLLFGGIMPLVNVRYGAHKGTVFVVDDKKTNNINNNNTNVGKGKGNGSEPLVASLFVPRNDKLVKIDGNLIIHSVLASEKAMMMSSQSEKGLKTGEETGLAIHGGYPPYPTPGPGSNNWRRPHLDRNQNGRQRALGSASASADFTPVGSDGKLQQWFREGLAGPMLSSGMCTEVFQFDTSPTPGSIVPAPATATSSANMTSEDRLNSTRPNIPKNRRLQGHAMPFNEHTFNSTEEQTDGLEGNKSRSSVVVSVLVDPREVGDGDGEGVMGSKTLPRIFVVVLIDSVKYVTYSCMLPFLGSSSHLVTA